MAFQKVICLSLLTLLLAGCSAEWHLTRAIKKDPTILHQDTISVVDSIVLPGVVLRDTVSVTDTIVLEQENLSVSIVPLGERAFVEAEYRGDTITRIVEVPVDRVVYTERNPRFYSFFRNGFLFYTILALVILLNWRWRRPGPAARQDWPFY